MSRPISFQEFCTPSEQLGHVDPREILPLPPPYEDWEEQPWTPLSEAARRDKEASLDDTMAVSLPRPKSKEEEDKLVAAFLRGIDRLLSPADNWTFLHPFLMSMEHCARCQTCSDACHIFLESGRHELYRPAFRSEIFRRLVHHHRSGGSLLTRWQRGGIDVTWTAVARLL